MKKWLVIIIAVAILLAGTSAVVGAQQKFKGQKITVLCQAAVNRGEAYKSWVSEFESLTGIKATIVDIGVEQLKTKVSTDLISGAGAYDVIEQEVGEFADYFVVMNDWIKRDKFDIEDYIPVAQNMIGILGGKRFGIPITAQSMGLFYNRAPLKTPHFH
jgi:multiple sugar transport system substrate-binding protein